MRTWGLAVLVLAAASALARGQVEQQAVSAAEDTRSGSTNADVVGMVKAGLSEETICLAIGKGANRFDISPAALIQLREQGVPDSLIHEMVRLAKPQPGDTAAGGKLAEGGAQAAGDSRPAASQNQPGPVFPPPGPVSQAFIGQSFSFRFPENWLALDVEGKPFVSAMLGPEHGIMPGSQGRRKLLCGVSFGVTTDKNLPAWRRPAPLSASAGSMGPPHSVWAIRSPWTGWRLPLRKSVKAVEQSQVEANFGLAFISGSEREFKIGRKEAFQVEWANPEAAGGAERGIELFVNDEDGLWTWFFVAPSPDFENHRSTFNQMIESIAFPAEPAVPNIPGRTAIVARSEPPGADVAVDGVSAGYTPNTIHPTVGRHRVSIAKTGFQPWHGIVIVEPEDSFSIDAKLQGEVKAR